MPQARAPLEPRLSETAAVKNAMKMIERASLELGIHFVNFAVFRAQTGARKRSTPALQSWLLMWHANALLVLRGKAHSASDNKRQAVLSLICLLHRKLN